MVPKAAAITAAPNRLKLHEFTTGFLQQAAERTVSSIEVDLSM
jgi:hypothetical protein